MSRLLAGAIVRSYLERDMLTRSCLRSNQCRCSADRLCWLKWPDSFINFTSREKKSLQKMSERRFNKWTLYAYVYTVSNTTNAVSVINNNARNSPTCHTVLLLERDLFLLGLPAIFKVGLLRGLGCAGWCPTPGSVSLYLIYSISFIYWFK